LRFGYVVSLDLRWRFCDSQSLNKRWQFGDQYLLNNRFVILAMLYRSILAGDFSTAYRYTSDAVWQSFTAKKAKAIWIFYRLIYAGDFGDEQLLSVRELFLITYC
jgi:hypothetical protein